MISLDNYTSMDETTYLLSSPANRSALDASIEQLERGATVEKTMDELEAFGDE